jgi:hypothetical protein
MFSRKQKTENENALMTSGFSNEKINSVKVFDSFVVDKQISNMKRDQRYRYSTFHGNFLHFLGWFVKETESIDGCNDTTRYIICGNMIVVPLVQQCLEVLLGKFLKIVIKQRRIWHFCLPWSATHCLSKKESLILLSFSLSLFLSWPPIFI